MEKKKTKVCRLCHKELPLSAFGLNRRNGDGLQTECRECRHRQYYLSRGGAAAALQRFSTAELEAEIARRQEAAATQTEAAAE